MFRTRSIGSDEGQIDFRLHRGRKLDLGAFRCVTQTLQRHLVALATQVEAFIFLEFVDQPINQLLVDVVTAKVRVTVGGFDFDSAFAHFEDRNTKRTAAEVVHGDGLILPLVETVSQRRSRWLVDNSLYIESGDLTG